MAFVKDMFCNASCVVCIHRFSESTSIFCNCFNFWKISILIWQNPKRGIIFHQLTQQQGFNFENIFQVLEYSRPFHTDRDNFLLKKECVSILICTRT